MPTALVLSPHLDDAAFSCGGTLALLADRGWRVVVATVFTRSLHPATGFALACQRDKGLADTVDYMALRRGEDAAAMRILGAEPRWCDLPEAPGRGYGSAAALFGEVQDDDPAPRDVAGCLAPLLDELSPDLLLAPQGLGNHVDHRQVIRALDALGPPVPVARYRDTPYALRLDGRGGGAAVRLDAAIGRKLDAACAYGSQLGFQFGGAPAARAALRDFAVREGDGAPAERFGGDGAALAALGAA